MDDIKRNHFSFDSESNNVQKATEESENLSSSSFHPNIIQKICISNLVPHEGVLDWHLKEIRDQIEKDGYQARPISVSSLDHVGPQWRGKFMIHNGHHRTGALKALGCTSIMCSVFDYSDPRIKVFDYDTVSIPISKEVVIQRAVSGINITPRFDKHFIELKGKLEPFHNNPIMEPYVYCNLSKLKQIP